MTPKQKKFAALAPPRNKITYADKIAGATKAKRGKTKVRKAQKGVAIAAPKKKSKMIDDPRISDRDLVLATKKKQEAAKLKSKMKKAGQTTPRRAGGLTAAVKKIKADKGKTVFSDRLKAFQKQTSMKMKSPKLVRMKALAAQTKLGRRKK